MKKPIKQITITPDEARKMAKKYILEFVMMHINGTDTYNIYEKSIDK